ncbi:hypothetical protein SCUP234_02024 [Seiridium cupressi]
MPLNQVVWKPKSGYELWPESLRQGSCGTADCGPPYDACHPQIHLACDTFSDFKTNCLKDCPHTILGMSSFGTKCWQCTDYACQFLECRRQNHPSRLSIAVKWGTDSKNDCKEPPRQAENNDILERSEKCRCCWQAPKPLFLVNRMIHAEAQTVFFSQNSFHVSSDFNYLSYNHPDNPPYPDRCAASVFLLDKVPPYPSALSSIRSLELDLNDCGVPHGKHDRICAIPKLAFSLSNLRYLSIDIYIGVPGEAIVGPGNTPNALIGAGLDIIRNFIDTEVWPLNTLGPSIQQMFVNITAVNESAPRAFAYSDCHYSVIPKNTLLPHAMRHEKYPDYLGWTREVTRPSAMGGREQGTGRWEEDLSVEHEDDYSPQPG